MEEALRAALLAYGGLASLVGTRIDWGMRPDGLPSVRLQVVSKVPLYTYGGLVGLTPHLIQADCFGDRYGVAKRVAREFAAAIGTLSRPAWDACFVEAERDDQDKDATGKPVHRTSLDVRLWHQS
jgi:hypothetical protein